MKKFLKHMVGIACLSLATPAAAEVYCSGYVRSAFTDGGGNVVVSPEWHPDWLQICNLNESWKGISPQICWSWFSQIQNGMANNQTNYFYYALPSQTACNSLPTYGQAPAPGYIMNVRNAGSSLTAAPMPAPPGSNHKQQ
ncbi:hypothetical protein [Allosphingosinicella vermicomposti]|uniref:hypothetical protein n=1 Tax=Allosphingosinicella vermicomposti TaxID=614671 RepID=UPI00131A570C|nr:hypothetical protein [Allosphingosinicella vermicomposti]